MTTKIAYQSEKILIFIEKEIKVYDITTSNMKHVMYNEFINE